MAAFNKINVFVKDLAEAKHNFATTGNTFKLMLSNVAPVATNQVKGDITEISAGFGYTAGGTAITITSSAQSSGTYTVKANAVVFTASGGSIGPFQYVVLYNDTTASPVKPLVDWWNFGSALTLADTDTFTVTFDASNGIFQIA